MSEERGEERRGEGIDSVSSEQFLHDSIYDMLERDNELVGSKIASCTLAGLAVLGGGEAHLTLAAVATRGVQTLAVRTQVHVVCTLIRVCTGGERSGGKGHGGKVRSYILCTTQVHT